jgi:predicted nucleotidyltransferase
METASLVYDKVALAEICRRWHIRELKLFGSQARGDARPDSDVDLMVSFQEGKKPGGSWI